MGSHVGGGFRPGGSFCCRASHSVSAGGSSSRSPSASVSPPSPAESSGVLAAERRHLAPGGRVTHENRRLDALPLEHLEHVVGEPLVVVAGGRAARRTIAASRDAVAH